MAGSGSAEPSARPRPRPRPVEPNAKARLVVGEEEASEDALIMTPLRRAVRGRMKAEGARAGADATSIERARRRSMAVCARWWW